MKNKAFTLAEVLITLTILGVIAAVTIPSIHRNFQDRMQITALRKAVATMDSAIKTMYLIEGMPNTYNYSSNDDTTRSRVIADKISKYLNVMKLSKSNDGVFYVIGYKRISGGNYTKYLNNVMGGSAGTNNGFIQTKDGVVYTFLSISSNGYVIPDYNKEKYYFRLFIDINGPKAPNRLGYDVFYFPVTDKGILLHDGKKSGTHDNMGTHDNIFVSVLTEENCRHGETRYWPGYSCGNYVMRHGNMNYKYRDVSAEW